MTTIRQAAFSAVRWTTFSMLGRASIGFLQLLVLVRLLTPADFGLMALAGAALTIAQIISDVGIGTAIVHHQKIGDEELSSLYWANMLTSCSVMLLVMAASPWLALAYGEPRMQVILMLVSTRIAISAISQPLRSLAEKSLRFKELALIDMFSAGCGLVAAIVAAKVGEGVLALVYGILVNSAVSTTCSWMVFSRDWKPMWRLRYREIASYVHFGLYTLGFSVTNAINAQADIMVGGRILGPTLLGAYSVPKDLSLRLAMLVNPIVTRVGFPLMAKAQADTALLKRVYLKTILLTSSINFPIYLALAAFAPEVVRVVLGEGWQDSAPILRILALWGLVRSTGNPAGSLVFAMGKTRLAFWWSFSLIMYFALAALIGAAFGARGLAISMLVAMMLIPIPQWHLMVQPLCGARFAEFARQLLSPMWISCVSVAGAYLLASYFEQPIARLVVAAAVGTTSYLGLSWRFNLEWIVAMRELLLGMRPGARAVATEG